MISSCKETLFNVLFFKCIEAFRQRRQFVDISYFLLYSGLESYARSVTRDTTSNNASVPICKLLKENYQFDVHQELKSIGDNRRAVAAYTQLRNALFHNSSLECSVKVNGTNVQLNLSDYLGNFEILVSLVILKAVDFDDTCIEWDSWISMQ